MNSVGSIWRKWDLHIHTPASFHWPGKHLDQQSPAEREATCQAIVDKVNALDIDVFCIMDYWTFEGYLALREHLQKHPGATGKRIFPGIELRVEAPTNHRLNTHVLFDDGILGETLAHFLARLCMGGPVGKPPSRQNLIDLGGVMTQESLGSIVSQPRTKSTTTRCTYSAARQRWLPASRWRMRSSWPERIDASSFSLTTRTTGLRN